ncbi:MarR family transcriptional regulator [Herbiconiux moechotypicola]|uniref:HTH marR-type domain-containing protein n=1 Tax=Herbiconiux moechotypicola TaxID=637393 RepID=A0ABN3DEQ0_9MICO|nr:MarR family transcriptional regulator [Herbiconiux moechotypicola]MCS5729334.1 MarR family transcriptional regulator [Herbiconiux moechotypicola]
MPVREDEIEEVDGLSDTALREAIRTHSAGNSLGFMLWHASLRWQRTMDAVLSTLGLTHAQFHMLATVWWLSREGAVPNQRHVAEHAGMGEVMASQVLRSLQKNELIVRSTHPDDARAMALSVTARGKELAERAVAAVDEVEREFFDQVDGTDDLLEKLRLLAGRTAAGDAQERRS